MRSGSLYIRKVMEFLKVNRIVMLCDRIDSLLIEYT